VAQRRPAFAAGALRAVGRRQSAVSSRQLGVVCSADPFVWVRGCVADRNEYVCLSSAGGVAGRMSFLTPRRLCRFITPAAGQTVSMSFTSFLLHPQVRESHPKAASHRIASNGKWNSGHGMQKPTYRKSNRMPDSPRREYRCGWCKSKLNEAEHRQYLKKRAEEVELRRREARAGNC
jgi:hypothetical protein